MIMIISSNYDFVIVFAFLFSEFFITVLICIFCCFFTDEPKLNSGAWEDPLPISNANKGNNGSTAHLHSIGSRRSEPFSALRVSNKLNTNPLSSVAAAAVAAASLQNGNYTLTTTTLQQNYKNRKRLEHTPSSRTVSSDEGWCSERGEHDLSSDGEDEDKKSINSLTSVNTRNSHLRSTLNKAKQHLSFDKWRGGGGGSGGGGGNQSNNCNATVMPSQQPETLSPGESSPGGRLSRWFSIRRGSAHQYDFGASKHSGRDSRSGSIESDTDKTKQSGTLNGTIINGYKLPLLPEVSAECNNQHEFPTFFILLLNFQFLFSRWHFYRVTKLTAVYWAP